MSCPICVEMSKLLEEILLVMMLTTIMFSIVITVRYTTNGFFAMLLALSPETRR